MIYPDQKNFGVAGNPISHSLSPIFFNHYFDKTENNHIFTRILGRSVEDIRRLIRVFEIRGLNVTAPFKNEIITLANIISHEVQLTQAANTLIMGQNEISAFNTDIDGVEGSLEKYSKSIENVLILGAGGAARSAIIGLKKININNIYVWNRTIEKAIDVASEYKVEKYISGNIIPDLIINTTPVIPEIIKPQLLKKNIFILDADYNNAPFREFAKKNNCNYIDGKEWIRSQGKKAYYLMSNIKNDNFIIDKKILIKKKFDKIALVGMMGTGKSTIGKNLAEKLKWTFIDLDKAIEEKEGTKIIDIFNLKGEDYFRKTEKDILNKVMKEKNAVVSTGGGIVMDHSNIQLLKDNCWNILLYGSTENLSQRTSDKNRPLLAGKNKYEEIDRIFNYRKNAYFRTADVVLSSDADTYINIAQYIYEDISKSFKI